MKQKGFTLIELLAVIVILAIIALIAVPVILNVIEKSKIGAAEQSAQGYVDAVEKQIVTNKVKNENLIEEGEYTKSQLDEKNVKIKGEITDVVLVVGEKGRVTQARFCINGYSIDYDGKKATKNSEANYCNEMNSIVETCPYEINQVFNFDYTGNIQEFTPECSGNYKLEVWGAQGGNGSGSGNVHGGYGGYSIGHIEFIKNQNVYIVIGGKGGNGVAGSSTSASSGYNGGGASGGCNSNCSGAGGGATHIAKRTGLLSSLESYKDDILIVAGGGGGANEGYSTSNNCSNTHGGSGGGNIGACGEPSGHGQPGSGGTQSSGGTYACLKTTTTGCGTSGSFGQGGTGGRNSSYTTGGGGGGGFYGGGGGGTGNSESAGEGGGGSGYIGNSLLINKGMYMYNSGCTASNDGATKTTCTSNVSDTATANYAKQGNGYARITYLGKE